MGDGANFRAGTPARHNLRLVAVLFPRREVQTAKSRRAGLYFDNSRLAGANAVDVAVLRRVGAHGNAARICGGGNVRHAHGGARGGTFAFGVNGTRQGATGSGADVGLFKVASV